MEGAAANLVTLATNQQSNALKHFLGGSTCKGQQQNVRRMDTLFDEASDPIDQGLRFPTSSTGNHQKWPVKRKDDFKLRSVQRRFIVNTRGGMRRRI